MLLDLDPWVRESIYLCHQVDFIKNMDITGALHEFKVNVVNWYSYNMLHFLIIHVVWREQHPKCCKEILNDMS